MQLLKAGAGIQKCATRIKSRSETHHQDGIQLGVCDSHRGTTLREGLSQRQARRADFDSAISASSSLSKAASKRAASSSHS